MHPGRKPVFVEIDGRSIDTSSQEWLLICLARHICRMPTKEMRNSFMEKLKWEAASVEELRQITRTEWQRMYPNVKKKTGVVAYDNA